MKKLLFLGLVTLFTLMSCSKVDSVDNDELSRRPDPINGSTAEVVVKPAENWNVQWDTTWNCGQVLVNWNDQGSSKYYFLFEGPGNGSCSYTIVRDGVTYYYPWVFAEENSRALLTGQICGLQPRTTYNCIIVYYEFSKGKWNEYRSTPTAIPFSGVCD